MPADSMGKGSSSQVSIQALEKIAAAVVLARIITLLHFLLLRLFRRFGGLPSRVRDVFLAPRSALAAPQVLDKRPRYRWQA